MSSPDIILRQRYSLSFFTTTLLIALTTQSSLAFSINPVGPKGAIEIWDPDESYILPNQKKGTTILSPTAVFSLPRGGTQGLLDRLNENFSDWAFKPALNDLAGSFEVRIYDAIGTPEQVGAGFQLFYKPGKSDPTLLHGSSLKWIQRVVSNHSVKPDKHSDKEDEEDVIDNGGSKITPFYIHEKFSEDLFGMEDLSRRVDADKNHKWLAELYLVEETEPQQITIYNGIQWGWENKVENVQGVPEPLTIFASGVSLGFGVLFKKTFKETEQKRTKQKVSKS